MQEAGGKMQEARGKKGLCVSPSPRLELQPRHAMVYWQRCESSRTGNDTDFGRCNMRRFVGTTAVVLALLLAILALITSGVTLYGLLQARRSGLEAIAEARAALRDLGNQTIDTTIPFNSTFPIQTDVPFQQEFAVPIHTTIPISTVVQVPVTLPVLGTYEISVPVATDVPIDLDIVVPISQTVRVETTVEVNTSVPLHLEVSQLGIQDLLEQIDAALAEMEDGLGGGRPASEGGK